MSFGKLLPQVAAGIQYGVRKYPAHKYAKRSTGKETIIPFGNNLDTVNSAFVQQRKIRYSRCPDDLSRVVKIYWRIDSEAVPTSLKYVSVYDFYRKPSIISLPSHH